MAAVMLAIQHLNAGDGSIVPELAGLDEVRTIIYLLYLITNITFTSLILFC